MGNEEKTRRSVLLRCCLCIGGALGIVGNCIGIYFSPMASSLGTGVGSLSVIVTLMSLATAFFAPVFAKLIRRIPIRYLMSAGVMLCVSAYMIMSVSSRLWTLYLGGVVMGIGSCCFSSLPVTMILREWYGDRIGSVTGIAMGFGGVFGAVCNPLLSRLITSLGWNTSLRIQGLLLLVLVLPCAYTMRMNPAKVIQKAPAKRKEEIRGPSVPAGTMVLLTLTAVCFSAECGMNSHFSALGVDKGYTLAFSSVMLSAAYIANVSFKLIHGWIADRSSPFVSTILCCSIGLAGTLCLLMLSSVGTMMLAGAFLYGSYFSCSTVGTSLLTQTISGDDYAKVYSRITMFASIAYALAASVYGILHDISGSYTLPLMLVAFFSASALIMVLLLRKSSRMTA